jgi:hypothetical protein
VRNQSADLKVAPLPGYVSNHVPRAGTGISADFRGCPGVALRRVGNTLVWGGQAEQICSARVDQSSTCSAMVRASSTSVVRLGNSNPIRGLPGGDAVVSTSPDLGRSRSLPSCPPINRDHACEHERKSEFCFEVGNETRNPPRRGHAPIKC